MSRFNTPQMGDSVTQGFRQSAATAGQHAAGIKQDRQHKESMALTQAGMMFDYQMGQQRIDSQERMTQATLLNRATLEQNALDAQKEMIRDQREHDLKMQNAILGRDAQKRELERRLLDERSRAHIRNQMIRGFMGIGYPGSSASSGPAAAPNGQIQGGSPQFAVPTTPQDYETFVNRHLPQTYTMLGGNSVDSLTSSEITAPIFEELQLEIMTGGGRIADMESLRSSDAHLDMAGRMAGEWFRSFATHHMTPGGGDQGLFLDVPENLEQVTGSVRHLLIGWGAMNEIEGESGPPPSVAGERVHNGRFLKGVGEGLRKRAGAIQGVDSTLTMNHVDLILNKIKSTMPGSGQDLSKRTKIVMGYTDEDGTRVPGIKEDFSKIITHYRNEGDEENAKAMEAALHVVGSYLESASSSEGRKQIRAALLGSAMDPETGIVDPEKIDKKELEFVDAFIRESEEFTSIGGWMLQGNFMSHRDKNSMGRALYEINSSVISPQETAATYRFIAAGDMEGALESQNQKWIKTQQRAMKNGGLEQYSPSQIKSLNKAMYGSARTLDKARELVDKYAADYMAVVESFTLEYDEKGRPELPKFPTRPMELEDTLYGESMMNTIEQGAMSRISAQHSGGGVTEQEKEILDEIQKLGETPIVP